MSKKSPRFESESLSKPTVVAEDTGPLRTYSKKWRYIELMSLMKCRDYTHPQIQKCKHTHILLNYYQL